MPREKRVVISEVRNLLEVLLNAIDVRTHTFQLFRQRNWCKLIQDREKLKKPHDKGQGDRELLFISKKKLPYNVAEKIGW
jgi:hypothetical protein